MALLLIFDFIFIICFIAVTVFTISLYLTFYCFVNFLPLILRDHWAKLYQIYDRPSSIIRALDFVFDFRQIYAIQNDRDINVSAVAAERGKGGMHLGGTVQGAAFGWAKI